MIKIISSKVIDQDRDVSIIITTGAVLTGKIEHVEDATITITPADDPDGIMIIPWASILYIAQGKK